MAVLYIKGYSTVFMASQGLAPLPVESGVTEEQTLAIGGTSVMSAVFNARTQYVRLCADAVCAIAIGPSPTAQAASGTGTVVGSSDRLPANVPEYRAVGGFTPPARIAVISTT